jgi:hypothetical protein
MPTLDHLGVQYHWRSIGQGAGTCGFFALLIGIGQGLGADDDCIKRPVDLQGH